MNVAVIDLGTNTFNLLICEISNSKFCILYSGKTSPKLGKDGIHRGIISPEAIKRGIHAIAELHTIITSYSCEQIHAIGTSALRNAQNAQEFCDLVFLNFGIQIKIIPGLLEAEYIFYGNKLAYNWGDSTALILDIGGGSNECIICKNSTILWKHSFENGMQRILQGISPQYPFTEENITDITAFLSETFSLLITKAKEYSIDILIGSSGPFDTFREILEEQKNEKHSTIPYYTIEKSELHAIHSKLIHSDFTNIGLIPGMDIARTELLPIASSITLFIIETLNIQTILQSEYSLKEGVIYSIINS